MRRAFALLCAAALFAAGGSASMASQSHPTKTFIVNTTTDAVDANPGDNFCAIVTGGCSLRAAVQELNALGQAANAITLPSGTYTVSITGSGEDMAATGDLDLRVAVTVQGTLGSTTIKAGTGFGDRIFDIPPGLGPTVTVKAVNIEGGSAPGGENGGGLRDRGTGRLTLLQVDFTNNTAGGSGGGLSQTAGTLEANIVNFTGNTAVMNGGGADVEGPVVATLFTRLTFTGNTARQGGGLATFVSPGATGSIPMFHTGTFQDNATTAGGYGGGMAIARTTASKVDVIGNTASNGGGIELVGSTLPVTLTGRVVISDNMATVNGGGVYSKNCGTACSFLHVVLTGNTATKDGSALYAFGGLTVEKTTINGNDTVGQGAYGGVIFHGGPATGPLIMTNMTIGENGPNGPVAGAVMVTSKANDLFTNVTIADNSGGTSNGITVASTAKPPRVRSTIISSAGTNCTRPLQSLGYNLESGNTCGLNKTGDLINTNPSLDALEDNGGGTHTMRPLFGSPVLDKADPNVCPIFDQRSARRPYDVDGNGTATCDIGAYEQGGPLWGLNNDVGFSSVTTAAAGGQVTYTIPIKNTGAGAAANGLVTISLPSSLLFVSCSSTLEGSCGGVGNNPTVSFATIGVGQIATITILADILGTGTIVTSLTAWSDNADWYPTDNTATSSFQA